MLMASEGFVVIGLSCKKERRELIGIFYVLLSWSLNTMQVVLLRNICDISISTLQFDVEDLAITGDKKGMHYNSLYLGHFRSNLRLGTADMV